MKSHWDTKERQRWKKAIFAKACSALPILLITAVFMACGDAPKAVSPVFSRPTSWWLISLAIIVAIPALALGIIYLIGILVKEPETEPERTIEEIIKGEKPVLKLDWQPLAPPPKPAAKISKTAIVSAMFCIVGIMFFVAFAIAFRHLDPAKLASRGDFDRSPLEVASKFFYFLFYFFQVLACLLGLAGVFKIYKSPDQFKGMVIAAMSVFVSLVLMIFWRYFGFF